MQIPENLIQFIWQFQYFNKQQLLTTAGEPVEIIHPGIHNVNQGPDFNGGRIKINDTEWAGSIEIHVLSSDWLKHNHSSDPAYKNVILHVVWEDTFSDLPFPTIELKNRVSLSLLNRYAELMARKNFIPCQELISSVNEFTINIWKDRVLAERMEDRSFHLAHSLNQSLNHWEEVLWQNICKSFGTPVNADAFEALANSLPLHILIKHRTQIHQVEALLLGQAGLLKTNFSESYPQLLQKEYNFLAHKYQLNPIPHSINFLRMRPAGFPTVRLAQLAMLIHKNEIGLLSEVLQAETILDLQILFVLMPNDYWLYHYTLDDHGSYRKKETGLQFIYTVIINGIIPFLYTYARQKKDDLLMQKVSFWLESLPAEENKITRGFKALGIENKHAADSQSLIQLKKKYCDQLRCLKCSIGNALLNKPL